jgi:hypothetical protein
MASRGWIVLDGPWLPVVCPMLRWLVLVGMVLGLGTGLRRGWIEVRWGRFLEDVGVPFVADPGSPECPPAQPPSSSASEARNPSR